MAAASVGGNENNEEMRYKALCFNQIASSCVRYLLEYLSVQSNIAVDLGVNTPGEALSAILQLQKPSLFDYELKALISEDSTSIDFQKLDTLAVCKILLKVTAFPTCDKDYEATNGDKIFHKENLCSNKTTCCSKCMKCVGCYSTKCTFSKIKVNEIRKLRNTCSHLAPADVPDQKKIDDWRSTILGILNLLRPEADAERKGELDRLETYLNLVYQNTRERYWMCIFPCSSFSEEKSKLQLHKKTFTFTCQVTTKHQKLNEVTNLETDLSKKLQDKLAVTAQKTLKEIMNLNEPDEICDISLTGITFKSETRNCEEVEVKLQINSQHDMTLNEYKSITSDESRELMRKVKETFQRGFQDVLPNKKVKVTVKGFNFSSINVFLTISSLDAEKFTDETIGDIKIAVQKVVAGAEIQKCLSKSNCKGCDLKVTFPNDIKEEFLTVQFNINYHNEKDLSRKVSDNLNIIKQRIEEECQKTFYREVNGREVMTKNKTENFIAVVESRSLEGTKKSDGPKEIVIEYDKEKKKHSINQLMKRLHLDGDKELGFYDVMMGRKRPHAPVTEKNVVTKILESILLKNFNGRECFYKDLKGSYDETDNIIDLLISSNADAESKNQESPLDVINVAFSCCNPFMKQRVVESLFNCKLSVPFVYYKTDGNPIVSSWSLRSLEPVWKSKDYIGMETPLLDSDPFVVSVMRIGRPSFSKSNLLNYVANKNYHHTFYNKDSVRGGDATLISCGTVESTWYLPSQKEDDSFSDLVMFLNMRGDLRYNPQVTKYICNISDVIFIVVNIEDISLVRNTLMKIVNDHAAHLILSKKMESDTWKTDLQFYSNKFGQQFCKNNSIFSMKSSGKARSLFDIKNEMVGKLKTCGKQKHESLRKHIEDSKEFQLSSDEDLLDVIETRQEVESLFERYITPNDENNAKELLVPLHMAMWKNWSSLNRKKYQSVFLGVKPDEKNDLLKEMKNIRSKQFKFLRTAGKEKGFVKEISQFLLKNLNGETSRGLFYLNWLMMKFKEKSILKLPALKENHVKKLDELIERRKEKHSKEMEISDLQDEVRRAEDAVSDTYFTFDHIIREIAQYYECMEESRMASGVDIEFLESLPKLGAKLLLNGYPLEIMDGDVSNVPLIWIQAVFNEIHKIVGEKRLFIVSVIGLTSSGKSTLLNTMFGAKFGVSAGRCTKGVYMQLFPVEAGFKFDYVLIIDTEGFRASEAEGLILLRDNELATLSIGLGDITLINIKGENMSDLKDILQISIHAFLKMKIVNERLKLRQSCMFIHQNVPAADADSKLAEGKKILEKNLNEVTLEAASQEGYKDIRSFSDVINYNPKTHIKYFSDLWISDPPMAASNPGYSDHAKNVKDWLLNDFSPSINMVYTFEDVGTRINDLWKGILSHDFIFSFRNSLEMKVYNMYEKSLEKKIERLRQLFDEQKRNMQIKTDDCEDIEDLNLVVSQEKEKTESLSKKRLQKVQVEQEEDARKSFYKDIVMNFLPSFQRKLEMKEMDLVNGFSTFTTTIKKSRANELERVNIEKKNHKKIRHKIDQLVGTLKNEESKSRKIGFDKMWRTLEDDLLAGRDVKDSNTIQSKIADIVENTLYDKYPQLNPLFDKEKNNPIITPSTSILEVNGNDIEVKDDDVGRREEVEISGGHTVSRSDFETIQIQARNIGKKILRMTEELVAKSTNTDQKFKKKLVKEMYQKVSDDVDKVNSNAMQMFFLEEQFKKKLMVMICRYSIPLFEAMDSRYERKMNVEISPYQNSIKRTVITSMPFYDDKSPMEMIDVAASEDLPSNQLLEVEKRDISLKDGTMKWKSSQFQEDDLVEMQLEAEIKGRQILKEAEQLLSEITNTNQTFTAEMAKRVFEKISTSIHEANTDPTHRYRFRRCFVTKLMQKICDYSIQLFKEMDGKSTKDQSCEIEHYSYGNTIGETVVKVMYGQDGFQGIRSSSEHKSGKVFNLGDVSSSHISISDPDETDLNSIIRNVFKIVQNIENEVLFYLDEVTSGDSPFTKDLVEKVLEKMETEITEGKKDSEKNKVTLEVGLQVKLLFKMANYSMIVFRDQQDRYDKKHSVQTRMAELKEEYYMLFETKFQEAKSNSILASVVLNNLTPDIEANITEKVTLHVETILRLDIGTKSAFMKTVLKGIVKIETFERCMEFIEDPQVFFKTLVREYAEKLDHTTIVSNEFDAHLLTLKHCIKAANKVKTSKFQDWLLLFKRAAVTKGFAIKPERFLSMRSEFIPNVKQFGIKLLEEVDNVLDNLKENYRYQLDIRSIDEVAKDKWGCEKKCVFCDEPCRWSARQHPEVKHSCVKHKPSGLCGWFGRKYKSIELRNCHELISGTTLFQCHAGCKTVDKKKAGMKFHKYSSYGKCPHTRDWDIDPNPGSKSDDYWKYFIVKFKDELSDWLQEKHGRTITYLPSDWKSITLEQAIASLDDDQMKHEIGSY